MTIPAPQTLLPCSPRRILITDDEAPVRDIFRMILAAGIPGCTIDLAANGLDAVESFLQFHPCVLLMDLKMPLMDGETAFARIREACAEKGWEMPAVIFCTGFGASPAVRDLIGSGSSHCIIQKPVASGTLVEAVRSRLPAVP